MYARDPNSLLLLNSGLSIAALLSGIQGPFVDALSHLFAARYLLAANAHGL